MTQDEIRSRIKRCKLLENAYNKEISEIDKKIKLLNKKKKVLAKRVSKNMQYRNILINKL